MKPQIAPAKAPARVANTGFCVLINTSPVNAPPKRKLPSAVMSAKSSKRNVMKIPIARIQHGRPDVNMSRIILTISIIYSPILRRYLSK